MVLVNVCDRVSSRLCITSTRYPRLSRASILEYPHLDSLVRCISALAENQRVCANDLVETTLFTVILHPLKSSTGPFFKVRHSPSVSLSALTYICLDFRVSCDVKLLIFKEILLPLWQVTRTPCHQERRMYLIPKRMPYLVLIYSIDVHGCGETVY